MIRAIADAKYLNFEFLNWLNFGVKRELFRPKAMLYIEEGKFIIVELPSPGKALRLKEK